ncbi:3-methyl-2-oxobutanoate hydroxymethyltransferase [Micromonospora sp. NPDC050397]|uniref:3-methyl-2-oxobutanoate hydroxymethyltransferase n=1 Tax=Micromonospora sp. NPDC050397 TaxID=3364279 RepID=UPI00384FA84E
MSESGVNPTPGIEPAATEVTALYGGTASRRVRTRDLVAARERGERWAMLTSYDQYTASIFDQAGIPVLLVGDSAANNVFGYETTVPVTVDELLPLVRAVVRATRYALVVADLPFGSYEEGPTQALRTAVRFMKEGGCHAVKLEGGRRVADQIAALTTAGIPVMGHIGFTPQSEHTIGGYRVQGRGDAASEVLADARAVAEAGAFSVVLEMVPGEVAKRVTHEVGIPTIGIGAGPDTDAQVLVWQDMAGLRTGRAPRFVKRYADLSGVLTTATRQFAAEVRDGGFPAAEHTF